MSELAKLPSLPPQPENIVTDSMGYLSDSARKALDAKLVAYRSETKHEVGVWIGPSPKMPKAQWCKVVFDAWGVGRKGVDDGVVLFIFPDHPPRGWWEITVGWGLLKHISDREARLLAVYVPKPGLDAGDRDRAVVDVVNAIIAEIKE